MDNDNDPQFDLQMALCDVLNASNASALMVVETLLDIICDTIVIHNLPSASTLGFITETLASKLFATDDEDDPLPF